MKNGLNLSIPGWAIKGSPQHEAFAMDKFVLFIRDQRATDVLDFHPDKESAQKALIEYVTKKTGRPLPSDPEAAAALIDSYFDSDRTFYTIAGVLAGAR